MGVLEDMLKALDRIPGWARLQQVPSEIDELKAKVAALEEKLGGKWPPDICRYCGERNCRLWYVFPNVDQKGNTRETWKCGSCQKQDERIYKPGSR